MIPSQKVAGGWQCGNIRYEITGTPVVTAMCHCSMCRKASAAPVVAWAMFETNQVAFVTARPALYASSPEAKRGFCPLCGSQICFTAAYIPGLIDITIGSLDNPESMPPQFHYWDSMRLSWLHLPDDLPRHGEFPPQG